MPRLVACLAGSCSALVVAAAASAQVDTVLPEDDAAAPAEPAALEVF